MVIGLTPQVCAAYDPADKMFFYGKNSEYKVHAADASGEVQATFEIDREKVKVTKESKRAYFGSRNIPADRVNRLADTLPDEATYYHRVQVVGGLVFVFSVAGFGEPLTHQPIDVFSRSGEYLYRGNITIEEGKHVSGSPDNLRIQGDQVMAILEDDAGHKSIAKYRIRLPNP